MMHLKKQYWLLILGILGLSKSQAQQFNYKWKLDSVTQSGFFDIYLTPEITRYLRTDFSDLRIVDGSNKNVPHIIRTIGANWTEQLFHELPIVSNTVTDSFQTVLVLLNNHAQSIAELKLFLKNSSVSRSASLSGSNDNKKWFIIDDKLQLNRSFESLKDQYIQELNFPLSTYKYFKIVINNLNNDPLNVLKAGSYQNIEFKSLNPFLLNPAPRVVQRDSAKQSVVKLEWDNAIHLDRLTFNIIAPKFYSRNVEIRLPIYKDGVESGAGEVIGNFTIRSGTVNKVDFPRIKTPLLYCIVDNGDNPPLQCKEVTAEQNSYEIIAYLDKSKEYYLLLDDPNALAPNYDLALFKDSIPMSRQILKTVDTPLKITIDLSAEKSSENNQWWIWPALSVLVLSLGFLTFRLVQDMKKRDS